MRTLGQLCPVVPNASPDIGACGAMTWASPPIAWLPFAFPAHAVKEVSRQLERHASLHVLEAKDTHPEQLDYSNHNPCGISLGQLGKQIVEAYVDFRTRCCSLLWEEALVSCLLRWPIRDR